jgi:putative LysE/RhtB family amino acid efflux pump
MYVSVAIKSVLVGVLIAIPVGPVSLLSFHRALKDRKAGLASGLGCALADLVYLTLIELGLSAVSDLLSGQSFWLHPLGGAVVLCLGARIFLKRAAPDAEAIGPHRFPRLLGSSFILSVSNPTVLITLTALAATTGLHAVKGNYLAVAISLTCLALGSGAWWTVFTWVVARSNKAFTQTTLQVINRATGGLIMAAGMVALVL